MRVALEHEEITRSVLETVGSQHQVCPFELSLDVSVWVDAVICDYNYVFDPKVFLRRHFADDGGDYAFLVDEAHNLVDRARETFSADLNTGEIQQVRRAIKAALPRGARALSKLSSAMRKLHSPSSAAEPAEASDPAVELNLFPATRAGAPVSEPARCGNVETRRFGDRRSALQTETSRDLPPELAPLLDDALRETETWLARNQAAEFREGLLKLYFRLYSFRRTAELYDERFVTIVEPGTSVGVRLFCLDPSFLLRQALARGKAAVFFSATLTPMDYFRELLGGSPEDPALQLPSPFPPENLAVLVQDRIRTDFKARAATLGEVVRAIAALVRGRPGNYLVYFPSYAYLTAIQEQFQALCPAAKVFELPPDEGATSPERPWSAPAERSGDGAVCLDTAGNEKAPSPLRSAGALHTESVSHSTVRLLAQRPNMSEAEREAFLVAFSVEHGETLVGFAVMGGVFGEGIDLVGDRLIGAIIVGVGLPQLCVERDLMRDYFQQKTGAGFDYAYTFPGMNRVLQAIGRVIRSETDRGVVLLIDTRFAEPRYRRLFPPWWRPSRTRSAEEITQSLRKFWAASPNH